MCTYLSLLLTPLLSMYYLYACSQAITVGDTIYLSGCLGLDPQVTDEYSPTHTRATHMALSLSLSETLIDNGVPFSP